MSTDTLDDLGRRAAADLHARTRTIDTEAALASFGSPGGGHHRPGRLLRRPGRPVFVGLAAAMLVAVVAVGLVVRGHDDGGPEVRTQPAAPIDPADYGPVVATLRGTSSASLRADLHAHSPLADGAEVALAITGGRPRRTYSVMECAYDPAAYDPASTCGVRRTVTLDEQGAAVVVIPAWAVFDAQSTGYRNDCRAAPCGLTIANVVGEGEDEVPAVDQFPANDLGPDQQVQLPLPFAPSVTVPALPTLVADVVAVRAGRLTVRIHGEHAEPGRTEVVAAGFGLLQPGPNHWRGLVDAVSVGHVEVAVDGTFSAELELPGTIVDSEPATQDGVPIPRGPVDCLATRTTCEIQLGLPDGWFDHHGSDERALRPLAVPYPAGG